MKPLAGKSILVTRPKAQADGLVSELESLGATVYRMPAIEIRALSDTSVLDAALRRLGEFDWVVLTSVNGVKAVVGRMNALGIPLAHLGNRKIAVIGPATADEFEKQVRKPDLMPSEYVSEAIAAALGDVKGKRFLLARADLARKDLAYLLRAAGAEVEEVAAYQIVHAESPLGLPDNTPDFITLTSSAAARGTLELLKDNDHEDWMSLSNLVCIGPITAGTVREMGFEVAAEAEEYTVPGIVKAIENHSVGHSPVLRTDPISEESKNA